MRKTELILKIELVPETNWGTNLRSMMKKSDWTKLSKSLREIAGGCCEICEDNVGVAKLDAHETWEYDLDNAIQKLASIRAVCKPCHNTIHFGRAQKIGYERQAIEQFLRVNECTGDEFLEHLREVKSDYNKKSLLKLWKLDTSLLGDLGYKIEV